MALLQRIKPSLAQVEPERAIPLSAGMRSAGNALREQRGALGLSLDQIAAGLRIKPAYLSAIEEGRIDRLPGAAYAVGFVRAYSAYLGLDSAEISRPFRMEAAGLTAQSDLTFPMPLGERSRPGGGMLLMAAILALCGYGAWHYLATEQSQPERVTDVPADLLPPPKPTPPALQQPVGHAAVVPADAAGSTAAENSPAASALANPGSKQPAVAASGAPAPRAAANRSSDGGLPVSAPTGSASPAAAPVNAAPAVIPAPANSASATASPGPSPQGEAPRIYGAAEGASRIVLRATADTWIEVRDRDRSILFSGMLKPDDIYRAPDRVGLSMRTGNAGGLDVMVDGKPAASLGRLGTVRNLALDPKSLAQGGFHD